MRRAVLAAASLSVMLTVPLPAQATRPPASESRPQLLATHGAARVALAPHADTTRARRRYGNADRFVARATLGGLGWFAGAVTGGLAAVAIFGRDCGGCDDPGLRQFVNGALVGSIAGVTLGAGSVRMRDGCTTRRRMYATAVGASIGTVFGIFGTAATDNGAVLPIVAAGGGALTSLGCRWAQSREVGR